MSQPPFPPPTYDNLFPNGPPRNDDGEIELHIIPNNMDVADLPSYESIVQGQRQAAMVPLQAFMVPGPGPAAMLPGPGPQGLFHGIPVGSRISGAAVAVTLVGGMIGGILAFLPRNDNQCYRQDNGDTLCTINWLHKPCVENVYGNMVCPSLCISDEYCPSVPQDTTTQKPGIH